MTTTRSEILYAIGSLHDGDLADTFEMIMDYITAQDQRIERLERALTADKRTLEERLLPSRTALDCNRGDHQWVELVGGRQCATCGKQEYRPATSAARAARTEATPIGIDANLFVVIEPAANYVVYDGTAYGPFWAYELATLYRKNNYPNGLVRDGRSKDVLLCKKFVDITQPPAPAASAGADGPVPARGGELSAPKRKQLALVADHDLSYIRVANNAPKQHKMMLEFEEAGLVETYDVDRHASGYERYWRITDAGKTALETLDRLEAQRKYPQYFNKDGSPKD